VALYRDEGVVLRTIKLGEADRIVTIQTRERGKVRAVAKGIRKTSSRFGGRLEPTSHVSLQLYEGRELDTITQVESLESFRLLREDLDRLARALTLLEAVDLVGQERQADERLLDMLLGALRALERRGSPTLVPAFLFRLLAHEGLAPEVDGCGACGRQDDIVAFDHASGGVLCGDDRRGVTLAPGALALLRDVLGGRLGAALDAEPSPATQELDGLAMRWFEFHVDRRLRSGHVLS
jgi:DNA repair protein RecO (recombination protein O)